MAPRKPNRFMWSEMHLLSIIIRVSGVRVPPPALQKPCTSAVFIRGEPAEHPKDLPDVYRKRRPYRPQISRTPAKGKHLWEGAQGPRAREGRPTSITGIWETSGTPGFGFAVHSSSSPRCGACSRRAPTSRPVVPQRPERTRDVLYGWCHTARATRAEAPSCAARLPSPCVTNAHKRQADRAIIGDRAERTRFGLNPPVRRPKTTGGQRHGCARHGRMRATFGTESDRWGRASLWRRCRDPHLRLRNCCAGSDAVPSHRGISRAERGATGLRRRRHHPADNRRSRSAERRPAASFRGGLDGASGCY